MDAKRGDEAEYKDFRQRLELIVNNPEAAEAAFDSEEIRRRAVAISDSLHEFARDPTGDQK